MSLLLTVIVATRDWKTLREQNQITLVGQAQQARAIRYQVYRNIHDASQALIIAELPDDDALRELRRVLAPTGRLVVGEVLLDPHVVIFGRLQERAGAAGLRYERRSGGRIGYFARFSPA